MQLSLLQSTWPKSDYQLLDSGNSSKLEQFGSVILSRPEPQALWQPSLPLEQWQKLAQATFKRANGSEDKGQWIAKPGTPEQWWIKYNSPSQPTLKFSMRMGLTAFKHVGVFPEQAANWEFIHKRCLQLIKGGIAQPEVLNMFAYTGGATFAAATAGAKVTHVDSIKQTVAWGRENMEASSISDVRWIVEDALKFAHREVRRGRKYNGIILDPPSYGRGADGEKWVLTDSIHELLSVCGELLANGGFLVFNLYSMGLSALLAKTLVTTIFGHNKPLEMGELYLTDQHDKDLPLGVYIRF